MSRQIIKLCNKICRWNAWDYNGVEAGFPNYNVPMSFIRYIRSSALTKQSWCFVPSETITCAGRHRSVLVEDGRFIFLCRIRLGRMEQDLGIRFFAHSKLSPENWSNFLYFVLGSWPFWLDKSTVMQRLPPIFKESYPQTRVIIDCTEIRVQNPSYLVLNSQTYSSYKGTSTFKCLIGIAPHGTITFGVITIHWLYVRCGNHKIIWHFGSTGGRRFCNGWQGIHACNSSGWKKMLLWIYPHFRS